MRAEITKFGNIKITPDNPTEAFALLRIMDDHRKIAKQTKEGEMVPKFAIFDFKPSGVEPKATDI